MKGIFSVEKIARKQDLFMIERDDFFEKRVVTNI